MNHRIAQLPRAAWAVLGTGPLLAGVVLLVLAVPKAAGAQWAEIGVSLKGIGMGKCLLLCGLWAGSLWSYTAVLSAALPGLSRPRALMLNCTSSACSNLLPLGGGAGVAVTYAMAQRWGHRPPAIAACVGVTGVCNVGARLLISALGALLLVRTAIPGIGWAAGAGATVLTASLLAAVGWRVAGRAGLRPARRLASLPLTRRLGGRVGLRVRRWLRRWCAECRGVVHRSWRRLLWGMAATLAAQGLLFLACLYATGAGTAAGPALAVFAASRMLTQIAVTPNGIGVTESAVTVALVALGGAPGPVAAGTLLFAVFTQALEIPLGLVTGALWLLRWGRTSALRARPAPHTPPPPAAHP
ncbi:YbhN family protein [Streptomyces sp. NPDC057743]|uniref:lysylphosphatidylglycerol synthase transmembrane domain-containing protein n=1 Tax=Streptomyces sp. NPDC057743 TaxID=3346236 RepID=UPI0036C53900